MRLRHERIGVKLPELSLAGDLSLPYAAHALLILVSACAGGGERDAPLDEALHRAGFATLHLDLLCSNECRFSDAEQHLPLLTGRLLAVVGELRQQIALEAIPALPIGMLAAGPTTPLAVRVAAQRDQEIRALVCHGGLIDLAGLQYLKVLRAPLLLLADADDDTAVDNAERARPYLSGICRVERLPAGDAALCAERRSTLTTAWFRCHLAA